MRIVAPWVRRDCRAGLAKGGSRRARTRARVAGDAARCSATSGAGVSRTARSAHRGSERQLRGLLVPGTERPSWPTLLVLLGIGPRGDREGGEGPNRATSACAEEGPPSRTLASASSGRLLALRLDELARLVHDDLAAR